MSRVHPEETMVVLGYAIYRDSSTMDIFDIEPETMINFLAGVERGYLNNPYHNHLHGIDVGQSVHFFLHYAGLGDVCTPLEKFALVTAGFVHDMGHWGLNNNWLSATDDDLALTYNYISPLENLHASKVILTPPPHTHTHPNMLISSLFVHSLFVFFAIRFCVHVFFFL
jgi:hypothetical protein